MKRKILWISILLILMCVVTFFFLYKREQRIKKEQQTPFLGERVDPPNDAVSFIKNKASLEDINSNDTVLAIRNQNDSWGHADLLMIVSKNKQLKVVNLSEIKSPKNLLKFCDDQLQNKDISFEKEKMSVTNEILSELINVSDYKIGEAKRRAVDDGDRSLYSVCGSGSNRKMVLIKMDRDSNQIHSKYKKLNEFCDYFNHLFFSVLTKKNRPPNV